MELFYNSFDNYDLLYNALLLLVALLTWHVSDKVFPKMKKLMGSSVELKLGPLIISKVHSSFMPRRVLQTDFSFYEVD